VKRAGAITDPSLRNDDADWKKVATKLSRYPYREFEDDGEPYRSLRR
jgi:hypothetical protein